MNNDKNLYKLISNLFDIWNIDESNRLILLKSHSLSPPYSDDTIGRIGCLLYIHEMLRQLYPYNIDICDTWIHKKNNMLDDKTPLDVMLNGNIIDVIVLLRGIVYL